MSEVDTTPVRVQLRSDHRDEGNVHTLTVSNGTKLNLLDSPTMDTLRDTLLRCGADARARAIVLRGEGRDAWIGGLDTKEMARPDASAALRPLRKLRALCQALRKIPVPVIAAIHGYCVGAGLEVAACCDLRLASQGSSYGLPEVRVGLPSVVEPAVLPHIIGSGRARELALTGRMIDAPEAWRWGLLNGMVPEPALDALVESRIDDLFMAAPGAVRLQKRLCNIGETRSSTDVAKAGEAAVRKAYDSGEPQSYLGHLIERYRRPDHT